MLPISLQHIAPIRHSVASSLNLHATEGLERFLDIFVVLDQVYVDIGGISGTS